MRGMALRKLVWMVWQGSSLLSSGLAGDRAFLETSQDGMDKMGVKMDPDQENVLAKGNVTLSSKANCHNHER